MITTIEVLHSLTPNAEWTLRGDEIEWHDTTQTQPTDSEITAEVTRLQADYDSKQYARDRKAKYDALNQFELQYDDLKNNTTTWADAIDAIKTEIPK